MLILKWVGDLLEGTSAVFSEKKKHEKKIPGTVSR